MKTGKALNNFADDNGRLSKHSRAIGKLDAGYIFEAYFLNK
jgi:hypothetical protein